MIFLSHFNKSFFAFVVFIMLLPKLSLSQTAPIKRWDKTIGGISGERPYSIKQTTDGGYIICGSTISGIGADKSEPSRGGLDYWVIKIDGSGNKLWDKTLGGNDSDYPQCILQTADGGFIVGGYSISGISGDKSEASRGYEDYWIVKLDATGTKQWDKTIGGASIDQLYSIQQTTDGGYILGGTSLSWISGEKSEAHKGNGDYWIVKLDNLGNKVWDKTIGGNLGDGLAEVQQTIDGGYILGGTSSSGVSGDKTQPAHSPVGNYNNDYWIVKLNANGLKVWDKTYGTNEYDFLKSIQQTPDGGFILGGYTEAGINGDKSQPSQGYSDYWVIKLDPSGNKTWDKSFGASGIEIFNSVRQTKNGGYILGGHSFSGNTGDKSEPNRGNYDYWIMQTDSFGNKIWDKSLGGADLDELSFVMQTLDDGYIVGGLSNSNSGGDKTQNSKGDSDFWIIKLGGVNLGTNAIIKSLTISVFPNPNQGQFKLVLKEISVPKIEVAISDLLGKVVLQKELPVTNNQISEELELKNAKGMYLLKIKAGNQTTSRKIVVE